MSGLNFGTKPEAVTGETLSSNAFWPVIDMDDFKKAMRVDDSATPMRVKNVLISGITEANRQLAKFRQDKKALGIDALDKIASEDEINGESLLVINYRQAVYHYAYARLLEIYAGFDATAKGEKQVAEKLEQAETYRREGHAAIGYILGNYRVDAELL